MPGVTFVPGTTQVRPGVYVAIGQTQQAAPNPLGIVAAIFKADWGPVATPTLIQNYDAVASTFGAISGTSTIDCPQQAFVGGAQSVLAWRLGGAGGVAAVYTLNDSAAAGILTITAKYAGVRGNAFRVTSRVNLVDATKNDLVILEGTTVLQTITYTPGADAAAAIVAAVAAVGSPWVTVAKVITGTGIAAIVTAAALITGANPTVTAASYLAGMNGIETLSWNALVSDSNDDAASTGHTQALVFDAYVTRVRNVDGMRALYVVGVPTSVAQATRLANAAAFNNLSTVYVANGFVNGASPAVTFEGYQAAARVAGLIVGAPITNSLTHEIIKDGISITGAMIGSDQVLAIQSGALTFSMNALNQVQVEYGITTLVTPGPGLDNGWKKIRRVRTRDYLVTAIAQLWDPLIGVVSNNAAGRGALIAAAYTVITKMIGIGALTSGSCIEDPNNPPAGDSVWFVVATIDNDSAEKIYTQFNFSY